MNINSVESKKSEEFEFKEDIKIPLEKDVYTLSIERINWVFDNYKHFYFAFSGGKDSGLLAHLIFQEAEKRGIKKVPLMYLDFEAQYKKTIEYVEQIFNHPLADGHWICLPIHLRNAVSQFQPHWICWDKDVKDLWVRDYPNHPLVVTEDNNPFEFFIKGMEFEDFIVDYGNWISKNNNNEDVACFVSIRSDESLNRFRVIARNNIKRSNKDNSLRWSSQVSEKTCNFYPIYDWRTDDLWIANSKFGYTYNKIYDMMYLAGVPLSKMRLCQPYGDDQRSGLNLFHSLEPETWSKIVSRVNGANFGNIYCNESILGNTTFKLPSGMTYKQYAKFLLNTMPPFLKEHYTIKFLKYIKWWWRKKNIRIIDFGDRKLEQDRKIPTWRRVCKVLIKNDYWCKSLSFGQPKGEVFRQKMLIEKYRSKNNE